MYKNVRVSQSQQKEKKKTQEDTYTYGERERIIISNVLSITIRAEGIITKY